jgi:uncharacterized protein YkwD
MMNLERTRDRNDQVTSLNSDFAYRHGFRTQTENFLLLKRLSKSPRCLYRVNPMSTQTTLRLLSFLLIGVSTWTTAVGQDAGMVQSVEQAIIQKTNEFRKSKDLDAVETDESLSQAAKKFAGFMARTGKYGHRANDMTPAERAEAAGYDYCVVRENIAYRTNSGEVTANSLIDVFVQGWIDSPPHRENILADYVTETGVGVATTDSVTYYAVQMFGRPRSAAFQMKLTNESGELQTVVFRANDQRDEVELPPRSIVKLTRCFPTSISLSGSEETLRVEGHTELNITDRGLVMNAINEPTQR